MAEIFQRRIFSKGLDFGKISNFDGRPNKFFLVKFLRIFFSEIPQRHYLSLISLFNTASINLINFRRILTALAL